jgi:predicted Zn-ribbon and HTH transcriptional regulator
MQLLPEGWQLMATWTQHTCNRCGYVWYSRLARTPKRCANPHCSSAAWQRPTGENLTRGVHVRKVAE